MKNYVWFWWYLVNDNNNDKIDSDDGVDDIETSNCRSDDNSYRTTNHNMKENSKKNREELN